MRFLHTADWHLGRIFHGVHLTGDQEYLLSQIEDVISETRPDAYIVSGDIYDRAVPPAEAVNLLDSHLWSVISRYNVPTIVIAGNHDSGERLSFASRLMREKGLFISGTFSRDIEPIIIEDSHGEVYIYPVPYFDPEEVRLAFTLEESLDMNGAMGLVLDEIREQRPPSCRSVLAAHGFVLGGESSDSERPLSVGGTGNMDTDIFAPFDFTALGHLHRPQCVSGEKNISYSGSLMKYSLSELEHKKSISLVEMDKEGKCSVERIPLTPRRDVAAVEGPIDELLRKTPEGINPDDYLVVTLTDRGVVYDSANRLRQKYRNLIHVGRKYNDSGGGDGTAGDYNKISREELFSRFFEFAAGDTINEEELQVFKEVLGEIYREENE